MEIYLTKVIKKKKRICYIEIKRELLVNSIDNQTTTNYAFFKNKKSFLKYLTSYKEDSYKNFSVVNNNLKYDTNIVEELQIPKVIKVDYGIYYPTNINDIEKYLHKLYGTAFHLDIKEEKKGYYLKGNQELLIRMKEFLDSSWVLMKDEEGYLLLDYSSKNIIDNIRDGKFQKYIYNVCYTKVCNSELCIEYEKLYDKINAIKDEERKQEIIELVEQDNINKEQIVYDREYKTQYMVVVGRLTLEN